MHVRPAAVVLALIAIGACGADDLPTVPTTVTVVMRQGTSQLEITAEVAATVDRRTTGLMNRRSLAPEAGMLFVFRGPIRGSFHMQNTLIPLDIAFIRAGLIREIFTMTPCAAAPCPLTTPEQSFEAALEVNAGTFERAGIGSGASVGFEGPLPSPE